MFRTGHIAASSLLSTIASPTICDVSFSSSWEPAEHLSHTPFINPIMRIISALFGRKIGAGQELSALFRCCNYPHNSRIGTRFGVCERNSKIMRTIAMVRSKGHRSPHITPSEGRVQLPWRLSAFSRTGARKKSADNFQSLWTHFLLNCPHYSYADNWRMSLWKGY